MFSLKYIIYNGLRQQVDINKPSGVFRTHAAQVTEHNGWLSRAKEPTTLSGISLLAMVGPLLVGSRYLVKYYRNYRIPQRRPRRSTEILEIICEDMGEGMNSQHLEILGVDVFVSTNLQARQDHYW